MFSVASTAGLRHALSLAAALLAAFAFPAAAGIAAPNERGVSMGHLHYVVADVAAERDFWMRLGGTAGTTAEVESVQMPGVMILLSAGAPEAGPSFIDHVAFRVESLAAIEARGFELELVAAYPGIASIRSPGGNRVELFEEGTATNVGFEPEYADAVAERHNRPLVGALDSHHLHFYVPEDQVEAARDWYVARFGAVPGMRWRYLAADLPGMNLNFSAATGPQAATRGRSLDHIGFEIAGLEEFCRELASDGVVFVQPYRPISPALAVATLTDPWGTTIELTEGLGGD
jgi:catechol 2,3-dioxygenase-like lactoylglutathione lyase family enzyme